MKTIFKYSLSLRTVQEIELPVGANILDIQVKGLDLNLWAEIDTGDAKKNVPIFIFGTGDDINNGIRAAIQTMPSAGRIKVLTHLKSVQWDGFVWHVYLGRTNG